MSSLDELLWVALDGLPRSRWQEVSGKASLNIALSSWIRDRSNRLPDEFAELLTRTLPLKEVTRFDSKSLGKIHLLEPADKQWSPRALLQKEVKAWAETATVGFESEASLLRGGTPIPAGWCDGEVGGRELAWVRPLAEDLKKNGTLLAGFHTESDEPGRIELSLAPAAPVDSADQQILLTRLAPHYAEQAGARLLWSGQSLAKAKNAPLHIHLACPGWSAEEAKQAMAGWWHNRRLLQALVSPSKASFYRLDEFQEKWSIEDRRGSMFRLMPGDNPRIEMRIADSSANPYIALWATMRFARLGLESGLSLTDPILGQLFGSNPLPGEGFDFLQSLDKRALLAALPAIYRSDHES